MQYYHIEYCVFFKEKKHERIHGQLLFSYEIKTSTEIKEIMKEINEPALVKEKYKQMLETLDVEIREDVFKNFPQLTGEVEIGRIYKEIFLLSTSRNFL